MPTFKVTVYTVRQINLEKMDDIYLTLLDSEKQSSERTLVDRSWFSSFKTEFSLDIHVEKNIGNIVQVKLEKHKHNHPWFCEHIKVQTPSGDCFEFPCYWWLVDENEVMIREGTARLPQDDTKSFQEQRKDELESRRKIFRWKEWSPGFPMSIDADLNDLPKEVQFDLEKEIDWYCNFMKVGVYLGLKKFEGLVESWKDIKDIRQLFEVLGTLGHKVLGLDDFSSVTNVCSLSRELDLVPFSGNHVYKMIVCQFSNFKQKLYIQTQLLQETSNDVMENWNQDYMFGYQFLNGCNPVMIRKCMQLPDKFPVTQEMVKRFLKTGHTLQQELQAGNIYIADYEILKGVPASSSQRYLTAPICLLYKNDLNQIVPIAIQLSQTPGETSPIFLPSDNGLDWMLAKMWVKSSDFNVHQLVTHLLKTHLFSEVFEMAMYRQLSAVHPVYKLLMPHVRFTIAINAEARVKLIGKDGIFSKVASISGDGMGTLMKNAMETLTYKSLCFPEDIKARGMEDVPKYYYRDDGKMIWEAIHCFVSDVVKIYYDSDEKVQKDEEIQGFVNDVACSGMNNSANFPKSLESREQLVEYLTVVIFTASAQHAAVNFGQFDWYAWIPNSPSTMRKPPPQKKDQVDMKYIMDSLPDRDCSSMALATVWALTQTEHTERFLGMYPDMYFTEQPVKEAIKTFCHRLEEVTNIIKIRNGGLTLAYCYLSPDKIPNSVAI
ncbi:polyunsaturated fatty acid 5-lipoxygenase-like [Carassius carassius]|uniref:polyunsaturated fatty acid 5-lipoxygenase-like n=1 Tax=Carassius carassius TaxID=217509 RepID=UPI0028684009|nr:polyunsaturated fatty acid 5-lipoxygenase-like [Carassius carassius]